MKRETLGDRHPATLSSKTNEPLSAGKAPAAPPPAADKGKAAANSAAAAVEEEEEHKANKARQYRKYHARSLKRQIV